MRFLFFSLVFLSFTSVSQAEPAFRLLTTEAARNPSRTAVLGLQTAGVRFGDVFVDTNLLYDLAFSENLGLKYAHAVTDSLSLTAGARYITFVGGSLAETEVKKLDSRIQAFSLSFSGPMGFVGATYSSSFADFHLNLQAANISDSRVLGLVGAVSVPFASYWLGVAEAGYDFANKQPRLSLGIERNGPSFGLRFGATYVKIDDPFLHYTSVVPVIDFFWLLGEKR